MKKLVLLLLTILSINLISQEINLELESQYISVGDWTTLNVTSSNVKSRPKFKEVDGLELVYSGSSSSFSMINGKTSQSTTYMYKVVPQKEGEYKLPIFYSDNTTSNELTLYVEKNTSSNQKSFSTGHTFDSEYTMLFIDIPQRDLYSGEAIEVTVRAYFDNRYNAGIRKEPFIESGTFTLDLPWKYKTTDGIMINNKYWIEAKWTGYLTSLGSGTNNLKIKMESTVSIPMGNSNSFFRSTRDKEVSTTSETVSLDILPLPQNGRPKNFSGAIGQFTISSKLDSIEVNTGDPITLTMDIYGKGNFQRVTAPEIMDSKNWKVYPPSSSYSGNNGSNYQGVKTFQQILSPESTKETQTPLFVFNYFDPISKEYKTLKTKRNEIKVNKGSTILTTVDATKKVDFADKGAILKPTESPAIVNPENKQSNILIITILIFSSILLLSSIILKLLIKIGPPKKLIQKSEIFKIKTQISSLEKDNNYSEALFKLFSYVKAKGLFPAISSDSITANDIKDNQTLHLLLKTIEDIKYIGKEVDENEYMQIRESVIEELV